MLASPRPPPPPQVSLEMTLEESVKNPKNLQSVCLLFWQPFGPMSVFPASTSRFLWLHFTWFHKPNFFFLPEMGSYVPSISWLLSRAHGILFKSVWHSECLNSSSQGLCCFDKSFTCVCISRSRDSPTPGIQTRSNKSKAYGSTWRGIDPFELAPGSAAKEWKTTPTLCLRSRISTPRS